MKLRLLATAAALCFTFSVNADQGQINQIEQASRTTNIQALTGYQSDFEGYEKALAAYRLAVISNVHGQGNTAKLALDNAEQLLEQSLEQSLSNAETAEHQALLAQVYGMKIAMAPMKGVYYGPKIGSALAQAKSLAPNNPRVNLVSGISQYNTPTVFGGSKVQAIELLDKAISHYANDQSSGYHWGYSEAYVWKGIAQMDLGDKTAAVESWNTALSINPDYGWAKFLLAQNK